MYPTHQPGNRVEPGLVALLLGCVLFCIACWVGLLYLIALALA
jgi:hypothetical protein